MHPESGEQSKSIKTKNSPPNSLFQRSPSHRAACVDACHNACVHTAPCSIAKSVEPCGVMTGLAGVRRQTLRVIKDSMALFTVAGQIPVSPSIFIYTTVALEALVVVGPVLP